MDISDLRETWDALGKDDPLGVILSYPERVRDWDPEEFFRTGEEEIDRVLAGLEPLGLPRRRDRALDFGCGVGRLTQALCRHFERVDGADIAPSMIAAAERLDRHGDRCRYHLNQTDSLALFADATFDFVYSVLVLQHMRPDLARGYLGELARVLRPGGVLVCQLPSGRTPQAKLPRNAVVAEIEPLDAELELATGEEAALRVRVRNAGHSPWPALEGEHPIHLGNHWRQPDGTLFRLDDGRASFPHDLQPGEVVELELRIVAPEHPGDYLLELDLVQEGVAWFAQRRKLSRRRSRAVRVPCRVLAGASVRSREAPEAPAMEMHTVPRAEVEESLAAAGLRLVRADENDAAGPGWVSVTYTATRDEA